MRSAACVIVLALAACGSDDATRAIPRDAIAITVHYEGASPEVMDHDVVEIVEDALGRVASGVAGITSTSTTGLASIVVEVAPGSELDAVRDRIREQLEPALRTLPTAADPPVVSRIPRGTRTGRYYLSNAMSLAELSKRWRALDIAILAIPGVLGHRACGVAEPVLRVFVDADRARALQVDVLDVVRAIRVGNIQLPGGRVGAPVSAVDTIGELLVAAPSIRVRDIANLELAAPTECTAHTNRGAGIVGTVALGGADPAAAWKQVLGEARRFGFELVDLPAPATVNAIAALPDTRVEVELATLFDHLRTSRGVLWVTAETDATELRITVGVDRDADTSSIAAAIDTVAAASFAVTGPGLIAREAVIPAGDLLEEVGERQVALNLAARPGIANAGCTGCAVSQLDGMTIDRRRTAQLGIDPADVTQALAAMTDAGLVAGIFMEPRDPHPIEIRVFARPPGATTLQARFTGVAVKAHDGDMVLLAGLVRPADASSTPDVVRREDRRRVVVVWARAAPRFTAADVDRALREQFHTAMIRAPRPAR